ncbi:MFS transporter [Siccirubricoccus deserti]|uniref:MFS transporter n=1 Tax=Siccirubricoccus deserti TaxID=2013562 RepID=A0A9X0QV16_9PROT|nr:MFS transporter [Siccirubricoccus deserti]MBC4013965.1 MFS transporter [Siccirubricoccus deserti]GGC30942.1 MFS transporter [Siccirubricoccus deserti]
MSPAPPIALFALAGFTTGSGMRMLDPLLPMLAADLGVTVAATTPVVAAFVVAYGMVQLVAGPLGDRLGKPRIAFFALLLYGATLIGSAMAADLGELVGYRVLAGMWAGAVIPLLMAHLGDTVPYAERQGALARFSTGMVMAQMLAGPIAGIIAEFQGWRLPLILLGLLAFGVATALALRLRQSLWRPPPRRTGAPGYGVLLRRPSGRWLLAIAFFDGFCLFGGAFPFVGAFLVEGFDRGIAEAGLLVAGFGAGAFLYTRFARRLVRRFGERGLLSIGGTGLAVGLTALALAPNWWVVGLLQLGLGLMFYMFHGVLLTMASEALPEARGTAMSAFAMALFLGQGAGSLAFGLGLLVLDYRGTFIVAAIGSAALTLWARRGAHANQTETAPSG